MSVKKHIATAASWAEGPLPGMSPSRVGTRFLYTEKQISEYESVCAKKGVPAYLRRNGRAPDPKILAREQEAKVPPWMV